jgi:hypothetical protein
MTRPTLKALSRVTLALSLAGLLAALALPASSLLARAQDGGIQAGNNSTAVPKKKRDYVIILPDLVIRSAQSEPADDRKVRVQIVNTGNKNAGACTLKLFYHRSGKVMVRNFAVAPVPAGETQWMLINMGSPAAAASKITMRVDDPSVVKESNEGNNTHVLKSDE